jgi:hypothetical protein
VLRVSSWLGPAPRWLGRGRASARHRGLA